MQGRTTVLVAPLAAATAVVFFLLLPAGAAVGTSSSVDPLFHDE